MLLGEGGLWPIVATGSGRVDERGEVRETSLGFLWQEQELW